MSGIQPPLCSGTTGRSHPVLDLPQITCFLALSAPRTSLPCRSGGICSQLLPCSAGPFLSSPTFFSTGINSPFAVFLPLFPLFSHPAFPFFLSLHCHFTGFRTMFFPSPSPSVCASASLQPCGFQPRNPALCGWRTTVLPRVLKHAPPPCLPPSHVLLGHGP